MNDLKSPHVTDESLHQDEKLNHDGLHIIRRISEGDERFVRELYDQYARVLYGIIYQLVRDRHAAEDILQEVFVQIWRNAGTYDPRLGSPSVWLIQIARNKAIDYIRSKRYRQQRAESELETSFNLPASDVRCNPDSMVLIRQLSLVISHALQYLPTEQRQLIEMAYFEGYSQSELAKLLSIPLGTVKTRIRLGMLGLKEYFLSKPEFSRFLL